MDFHFLAVLFAIKVSDTNRVQVVLSQGVFEKFYFIIDFERTENCQEINCQQKYFLLVSDPFNIFELDYPKIVKE